MEDFFSEKSEEVREILESDDSYEDKLEQLKAIGELNDETKEHLQTAHGIVKVKGVDFDYSKVDMDKNLDSILYTLRNLDDKERFLKGLREYFIKQNPSLDVDEGALAENMGFQGVIKWQLDSFFSANSYSYEIDTSVYNNKRKITADENVTVFGWHPYWMGSTYKAYNFDLLSVISYFSYNVDPKTGKSRDPFSVQQWRDEKFDLVEMAHGKNVKVLLTVSNHGTANNATFLSQHLHVQQTLIDSLLSLVAEKGADGVDINFENIPSKYKNEFSRFVKNLSKQFRAKNPDYMVTLTVEPSISPAYDLEELMKYVDLIIMMGYEYHYSKSRQDGPLAPLRGKGTQLSLSHSVDKYLEAGVPNTSLLLALPYYGTKWKGDDFMDYLTYREIRNNYDSLKITPTRDTFRQTVSYTIGDTIIWWDDQQTLEGKYDWIIDKKLGGVGIWALGYDNGYDDLWAAIDNKFTEVRLPKKKMTRPRSVLRALRTYHNLIVVACTFLIMFMVLGFVVSFADWRVRQAFFEAKTFRLIYILAAFLFAMVLLHNLGMISLAWLLTIFGLLIGLAIMGFVARRVAQWRANLP